jgi:anti-anti-sigma factor
MKEPTMPAMSVSHEKVLESPRAVIIRIAGEVDETNGRRAESYFDEVLRADQPRHVLLDLSDLTFASTAFFSPLLFWKDEVVKRGGSLVLFGLRPEIQRTMRIFTLDRLLTIWPDRASALASLPKE